jgi:hypothetical protein
MTHATVPLTRPVALALWRSRETLPPDVRRAVEQELCLPRQPDDPGIDAAGWPLAEGADDERSLGRWMGVWTIFGLAVVAAVGWWAYPARGHEAPAGWGYDPACCSDYDCEAIPASAVTLAPDGWRIRLAPGQHRFVREALDVTVPFGDPRIRRSGDGGWHACISPSTGRVLCVYEPERLG